MLKEAGLSERGRRCVFDPLCGSRLCYWLVETGETGEPGISGAIQKRTDPKPSVYNTIDVKSVNECVEEILKNDGRAITEEAAVPGVGYFVYATDIEADAFGIMEEDKTAR